MKNESTDGEITEAYDAFWDWPLEALEDWQFNLMQGWAVDPDSVEDLFYPEPAPPSAIERVAKLKDIPLLAFGNEDSPYYGDIGILWDRGESTGWLYLKDCDQSNPVEKVEKIDPEVMWLKIRNLLLVNGAVSEGSESGNGDWENSLPDLDSVVLDPNGFKIYDGECVPAKGVETLIRAVYDRFPTGWIRQQCPTADDWLARVYGH